MSRARSSKGKSRKTGGDRGARLAALRSGAARAGGWALLIAAGGALALGAGPLERRAGEVRADPLEARLDWPAAPGADRTWLPASERRRLSDLLLSTVALDPTDAGTLAEARERLLRTGWFEPDLTLRRRPGGVIEVDAVWREPAAVVRHGGAEHVVSSSARRLPLTYAEGGAGPLRHIARPWGDPPPAGEVWTGGDVQAAIDLLALLRSSPTWPRVAGVDVGDYARRQLLAVVTTSGARVVWGSAPGEVPTGQVPHETRLARFEALLDDPAWLAAGRPRVELYLPRPVINESAAP